MCDLLEKEYKWPVLNDGFVRLVDYMGTDESVVQAARVSYGKGTKSVSDDRTLIRYLMRHKHTTPFEMCELKLHVRVPMDCWRQWIRHRTASVNEYSTRYSEAIDSCQTTSPDEWRLQATDNKQGSKSGKLEYPEDFDGNDYFKSIVSPGFHLSQSEKKFHEHARELYNERLKYGIAKEQARKDLPLSNYTEAYWKCNLHNLFHFLRLRMDSHAQYEIRNYANIIGNEIVSKLWPISWEAFCDYNLNSINLSNIEINAIKYINASDWEAYHQLRNSLGKRELKELQHKLDLLKLKDI